MDSDLRSTAPLISLPPPINHDNTKNLYDNLFEDLGRSQSLFTSSISTERHQQDDFPPTPSSEFGAFVSVPPSKDPLYQGSGGDDAVLISPLVEPPPSSKFFEQFTIEAKERTGQNERRVLDELLKHEDDPLYWLNLHTSPRDDKSFSDLSTNCTPDETPRLSSPLERTPSPQHCETVTLPLSSDNSSSRPPSHARQGSSSSLGATLPRKWMSSLLSSSAVASARTTPYDPNASPPQFVSPLQDSVGSLIHSSPFAAHVYTPPSGAPGFTGERLWNKTGLEVEFDVEEKPHRVQLTGRREETSPVLTDDMANQLRANLPALPRLAKSWALLYSLDQHGVSLQTFYAKCAARKCRGVVVVMRDSEDGVFGAWLGEQLRMSPGAYYGSGESFLWTSPSHGDHQHIQVFKWTGKNEYVALCESGFISFGGGEGKYGLYLDSSLIDGSSARCPTFDNEVLCSHLGRDTSKTVPFECVGLEAWAVDH